MSANADKLATSLPVGWGRRWEERASLCCSSKGLRALVTPLARPQSSSVRGSKAAQSAPGLGDSRKNQLRCGRCYWWCSVCRIRTALNVEGAQPRDSGEAGEVTVAEDDAMLLGEKVGKAQTEKRIREIIEQLDITTSDYEKEKLNERPGNSQMEPLKVEQVMSK